MTEELLSVCSDRDVAGYFVFCSLFLCCVLLLCMFVGEKESDVIHFFFFCFGNFTGTPCHCNAPELFGEREEAGEFVMMSRWFCALHMQNNSGKETRKPTFCLIDAVVTASAENLGRLFSITDKYSSVMDRVGCSIIYFKCVSLDAAIATQHTIKLSTLQLFCNSWVGAAAACRLSLSHRCRRRALGEWGRSVAPGLHRCL